MYHGPMSYTTEDLRQAIRNSEHNPGTTRVMNRAKVLAWMGDSLTMPQREVLISAAWDLCLARRKTTASP